MVDSVVFTGGAVVPFYLDRVRPADIRTTLDVDLVVEALTRPSYYGVEESLRRLGWVQPLLEDGPICRWRTPGGVIVDVMPSAADVLGFSNQWYTPGLDHTERVQIGEAMTVSVFSAPYFVTSKLAAFEGRGRNDWFGSHDLEDVLGLVEGRAEFAAECTRAPIDVRAAISEWASTLSALGSFEDIVEGHMSREAVRSGLLPVVLERIAALAKLTG